MKTYQYPTTHVLQLAGERMMDEVTLSYGGGGGSADSALPDKTYAPQSPKVR